MPLSLAIDYNTKLQDKDICNCREELHFFLTSDSLQLLIEPSNVEAIANITSN